MKQGDRSGAGGLAQTGGRGRRAGSTGFLARLMGWYIVIAVGRIVDLVPFLNGIPLAKLLVAVAIVSVMRNRPGSAAVTWKSVPPARKTMAVMGIITVSILWSVLRSGSFAVITGTVLAVVVTMLLVIRASRGWEPVKAILNGCFIASVVLVATVFTSRIRDAGGYRSGYSGSYDPNDFAFVLVALLPIVVTFGIGSRGGKRLMYLGAAALQTVAILLTQSRGGLLGLIVDVVGMIFLLPVVKGGRLQFRISKSGAIARVVLLAFIGGVIWQLLPGSARDRLSSVTELGSDYNSNLSAGALTDPNAGRLAIWARNLPLILDRPWGFGSGSFELVDGLYAGGRFRAPHNTLLQALMELGIPGFLMFIATIVSSVRYLKPPPDERRTEPFGENSEEPIAFARALTVGWFGLSIAGFFLSALYSNVLWTYVTLSCAVGIALRAPASATDAEITPSI